MYRYEDIQALLRVRPFRPFRIIASEGLRYDIYHPDLVLVGKRDVTIGFPASENFSVYEQVTRVALVHVVALEDIVPDAAPTNGPPSTQAPK
jgi:hypothetical protein